MQLVVVAVSAGLLVAAALVFLLRPSDDGDSGPTSRKSVSGSVQLTLGGIQNANAGAPAQLGDDAATQIMTALGQYVDQGLITPVKTDTPAKDLSGLFDAGTQVAIKGPDKEVLFENGQPERTGDFKPAAEPVIIVALSNDNGEFVLATAGFNYTAEVGVKGGTLKAARNIAVTFAPENGQWKITGYDMSLTREGAEVDVPTASAQR